MTAENGLQDVPQACCAESYKIKNPRDVGARILAEYCGRQGSKTGRTGMFSKDDAVPSQDHHEKQQFLEKWRLQKPEI